MSKKLYVPDRLLAKKQINPVPPSIGKGFGQDKEPNKNEDDPSKIDSTQLFQNIPHDLWHAVQYFNIPATWQKGNETNPVESFRFILLF